MVVSVIVKLIQRAPPEWSRAAVAAVAAVSAATGVRSRVRGEARR